MITQDNITLEQRLSAPTPKFWKKFSAIMGGLVTAATVIVTAPISVPAIVTTVAGYVIVAGGALGITAITLPVDFDALKKKQRDE